MDSIVHVAWNDNRDGNIEIYYKRSTDGGLTWGPDTRLTNSPGDSYRPSLAVSGGNLHCVWYDSRDGNYEIYYKSSTNYVSNWSTDVRLTNNSFISAQPFVTITGAKVHVIWTDNRDGNFEIYYKVDPTGNIIGIQQISTEIPKVFLLSQNYPNPFNPTTIVNYSIPKDGFVNLRVFDINGREVFVLVNQNQKAGTHEITFDAFNLSSGIYFYKLEANGYSDIKKMIVLK